MVLVHPSAAADRQSNQSPAATGDPNQIASVMLDGEVLFKVRGETAYPAEQRAGVIMDRLEAIASNEALALDSLRVEEGPDRSIIKLSDETIVSVYDVDAEIEGFSRQHIAEAYRARIKEAVAKYRHDRSPRVLGLHTLYALGVTTAFALFVVLVVRALRRFDRFTEQRYRAKVEGIRGKAFQVVEGERLWKAVRSSQRMLRGLVLLVLLFLYVQFVLGLYPWTRPLSQQLLMLFIDPLRTMGLALVNAVPSLIFLGVLTVVVRWGLKLSKAYFTGVARGTIRISGFDPDWAIPTYRILRLLVIAFAVVLAYPHVPGSQSEAFKGVSILLGVVFSLGSSSVVANIIAGYTMIYRRAFKVGDRIKIGDVIGDVTQMRLQVTHLRSLKNEEITLPNSMILNSSVTNFSRLAHERGLILHTTVGIGYETPWRQVEAMLLEAANRTPGVLREPAPFVLQQSLNDFAVIYELNVYCDQPQESVSLYSALHRNILDLFNVHGVQIMTPAYEGDLESPKVVPKDQWFAPPAKPPSPA
jgi:small-conductance mechanosensitive channel